MSRVRADLAGLPDAAPCAKPGCGPHGGLQRHHRRHEAIWVACFAWRLNAQPAERERYLQLVNNYRAFRPEDIVLLCARHHAEVHLYVYDPIITKAIHTNCKPLSRFSWRQAQSLMDKLGAACDEWLKLETPGTDPRELDKKRAAQRRARRR